MVAISIVRLVQTLNRTTSGLARTLNAIRAANGVSKAEVSGKTAVSAAAAARSARARRAETGTTGANGADASKTKAIVTDRANVREYSCANTTQIVSTPVHNTAWYSMIM